MKILVKFVFATALIFTLGACEKGEIVQSSSKLERELVGIIQFDKSNRNFTLKVENKATTPICMDISNQYIARDVSIIDPGTSELVRPKIQYSVPITKFNERIFVSLLPRQSYTVDLTFENYSGNEPWSGKIILAEMTAVYCSELFKSKNNADILDASHYLFWKSRVEN